MRADLRDRKWNCYEPRLQNSEERGDIVKSLRCDYHRPVAGRPAKAEPCAMFRVRRYNCDHVRAFCNAGPVLLVINEGKRRAIRPETGTLTQHIRNERTAHRYLFTFIGRRCARHMLSSHGIVVVERFAKGRAARISR